MKITDPGNIYKTSDLAFAAVLSLLLPLHDVDKSDPRRAQFMFERTDDLEETIIKFQRRELQVEPRSYFDQIKALKTRLYEVN